VRRRGTRPALRLVSLLGIFSLLFGALAIRLVHLQVVRAQPLGSLGESQRVREFTLPAHRGSILDRDNEPLAISTEARAITANPKLLAADGVDITALAEQIAPLIGTSVVRVRTALDQPDRGFVYLARRQTPQAAEAVMDLGLPHVSTERETMRSYPADDTAGQILGFVDVDSNGLSGIESAFDRILRGTPGWRVLERDPQGRPIPQGRSAVVEPVRGNDVVLTIDRDLQYQVEAALQRGVNSTNATRGTAIVLDAVTGEILAMANHPPLNPNDFGDADESQMRNRVVTDVYEPGSVFKVITASAAIENGIATPATTLVVPATIEVGGRVFSEYEYHPTQRMSYGQAIAQSSNVGTIKVAGLVGKRLLMQTMHRFGIGRAAGVGFPGESTGLLPPASEWSGTSIATIPIGQGVAVTPLQMASVYATLANDGVRVTPRLVRGTIASDGTFQPVPEPKATRAVSSYTAAQVRSMLVGVVQEGTGKPAQIPGYVVGGKTGTARVPRPDGLGYSNRIITSFAGLAPAEDPRLVALVQLEDPKPRYASGTAAPVWREIMQTALSWMGVPPLLGPGARNELVDRRAPYPAPPAPRHLDARAKEAADRARRR
jgi:cell division protein FtsI (penicillin-binding protein 3)